MSNGQTNGAIPPNSNHGNMDLYSQIAAGDEVYVHERQRRESFFMRFMVQYMRWTLAIDEKRREYQGFFSLISRLWACFMGLIYLSGFIVMGILIVSYIQFPNYIKDYLSKNGIEYTRVEIPGYIISQVELYNLHDRERTYQVDKLSIASTFSDFLNRRAKTVSIQGVKINLDENSIEKSKSILAVLSHLNEAARKDAGIRVDSLEVSNAVLNLKEKNYELPISFSMTGVYGRETNISSSISINEPYLSLKGNLNVKDSGHEISWALDIQNGSLMLPSRPKEELEGKISLRTVKADVKSIVADISLSYERLKKKFDLKLNKKQKKFNGDLAISFMNITTPEKPITDAAFSFNFSDLSVDLDGNIKTTSPLKVNIKNFNFGKLKVMNLTTDLKGSLSCSLPVSCVYDLKEKTDLKMRKLEFPFNGRILKNDLASSVNLLPKDNIFNFSLQSGLLKYDTSFEQVKISGKGDGTVNTKINIQNGQINGGLNLYNEQYSASLAVEKMDIETDAEKVERADLVVEDIFKNGSRILFSSPTIILKNNPYIKEKFSLNFSKLKDVTNIDLKILSNDIRLLFGGYLDLKKKQINGQLFIPEINLGTLKQPVNLISDILPKEILNVSGSFSGYGQISGNFGGKLEGPFYVALSDVNLKTDALDIQGLNAALSLRSLNPIVTNLDQRIYISRLNSFIPLENLDVILRFDEKFAQLSQVKADIFGIPVYGEETLLPYKGVGTLVYMKNNNENLTDLKETVFLKNWDIVGDVQGQVLFPIEFRDSILDLKNISVQLSNMDLNYTGKESDKPEFLENNKGVNIRSANVLVDVNPDDRKKIKAVSVIELLLEPTKIKKTLRDTFIGNLTDIIWFKNSEKGVVPAEIKKSIDLIRQKTKGF